MKEQLLEPVLRKIRINKVLPVIKSYKKCNLLDVGCGWEAKLLREVEDFIEEGVGIDFKAPKIAEKKVKTFKVQLNSNLPFEDSSFHVVTMLAVLEHLEFPEKIVAEIYRVLKPEGALVLTVPSVWSKPVLEFLSFKVGIVNPDEIRDHKKYYNKSELFKLFQKSGLIVEEHYYFQFGMNNFCKVTKPQKVFV